MVLASDEMLVVIAFPKTVNATTTPATTSAAATAYSESSKPFSSLKNRLIICVLLMHRSVSKGRAVASYGWGAPSKT
jgi:hypothetical protein